MRKLLEAVADLFCRKTWQERNKAEYDRRAARRARQRSAVK